MGTPDNQQKNGRQQLLCSGHSNANSLLPHWPHLLAQLARHGADVHEVAVAAAAAAVLLVLPARGLPEVCRQTVVVEKGAG